MTNSANAANDTSEINRVLRMSLWKLAFVHVLGLFFFVGLSFFFTNSLKQQLADQMADSNRASLILGDTRRVLSEMSAPILKNFVGVNWEPNLRQNGFRLPPEEINGNRFIIGSILETIFFDEHKTHKAGLLIFYFNRWDGVSSAIIAWLMFILLSIPITILDRKKMINQLIKNQELRLAAEKDALIAKVASQMAHDIRSPLATLDMVLKISAALPENTRLILREAIENIKDIANDLLTRNSTINKKHLVSKTSTEDLLGSLEKPTIQLLQSVLEPLISQKRLQYKSRLDAEILGQFDDQSYGLFASLQTAEFRRVCSNLVNNSVEAFKGKGRVDVILRTEADWHVIEIKDNGAGIPPEILARLGQRGETHGKEGGSGLGLYHAKRTIEGWGGQFIITSQQGVGTSVKLLLPKASTPNWFVPELKIREGLQIAVLDDDSGIHRLWEERFNSFLKMQPISGVKLHHFTTENDLSQWCKQIKITDILLLCDYELLGQIRNGLEIIEQLGISTCSILVTSRYENEEIRSKCISLNVPIIPKSMAGCVPVNASNHLVTNNKAFTACDCVLIDDSKLVRMTWNMASAEQKKILKTFAGPADFLAMADQFEKTVPIYIDTRLACDDDDEKTQVIGS